MLLGYALTIVYTILLTSLLVYAYLSRKLILKAFKDRIDINTIVLAILVVIFFVVFSVNYVYPAEQLYFDENIYQGIALNILHNGNAVWCQYGSAYAVQCPNSQIYHDPVEWSFYLAIAFFLFGTGVATAYGLQLFAGAFSIFLVFLLGSLLLGKRGGVASAVVFALIPELFVWSRTQAVPDLPLMMFTILAFLCYTIYDREKDPKTLALFLSALGIAMYIRIEAALLIPIFAIVYIFGEPKLHLMKRLKAILSNNLDKNALLILAFFILLIPQVYYLLYEFSILDYGSGTLCNSTSNHTFSVSNFMCNIVPNTNFFLGNYNGPGYFPAYFAVETTIIAILGFLIFILIKRQEMRKAILMLTLWIIVFHLFYDFFYAGAVTYGVDVRFMLQIYPAIALFAAAGIDELARLTGHAAKHIAKLILRYKNPYIALTFSTIAFLIVLGIFAVHPFVASTGAITLMPQNMPQEPGPLTATNFIYANYQQVPAKCLVFTFTPDIWYELNRSAAQVGFFDSSDLNFTAFASHYSCYVVDYGYWCVVPPFHSTTCMSETSNNFSESILASTPSAIGEQGNLTFYLLHNYTLPALRNSSYK